MSDDKQSDEWTDEDALEFSELLKGAKNPEEDEE